MTLLDSLMESLIPLLPFFGTILLVILFLWGMHRLLIAAHSDMGNERLFSRQLVMLGLTLVSVIIVAMSLPVSDSTRNQVIGLIGLVVSGVFAFSSSTIFANLMAGIMLRITKPYRTGEFISVGEFFGRVVERGLLDTEIQTEDSELVALPNTYMITHPISVVRSTGTIVSTTLSLGYDVHHSRIESLLVSAAKQCGLAEPFVQIKQLGDFAVTYKISGKLIEVKSLLTARSNLCRYVLDSLHGNGIEIVSPNFMNQRQLTEEAIMIPQRMREKRPDPRPVAETVAFDKAELAEQIENEKQQLIAAIQQIEENIKETKDTDLPDKKAELQKLREQLKSLDKSIEEASESDQAGGPSSAG